MVSRKNTIDVVSEYFADIEGRSSSKVKDNLLSFYKIIDKITAPVTLPEEVKGKLVIYGFERLRDAYLLTDNIKAVKDFIKKVDGAVKRAEKN